MVQDAAAAVGVLGTVASHDGRMGLVAADASTLTQQLRAGSRSAMTAIFTAHLDTIYNYCYRRTSSWSAAEDLSATVFLEMWRLRSRTVELDGSVLPWLYGIATNVCRNHLRSQRRQHLAYARVELVDGAVPPVDETVTDRLDTDRRLRVALARLAELPVTDQDVFVLVCWEELTYAQAAQALDIPIGTVRSRVARVRRALRLTDITSESTTDDQEQDRV